MEHLTKEALQERAERYNKAADGLGEGWPVLAARRRAWAGAFAEVARHGRTSRQSTTEF